MERYPIKEIRILWKTNKDGKIVDIIVARFTQEDDPQYLYGTYNKDFGNCNSWWDKKHLYQCLLDLWFTYGFADHDIERRFISIELPKIKEFQDDVMIHEARGAI
jgi:hypothetical protein